MKTVSCKLSILILFIGFLLISPLTAMSDDEVFGVYCGTFTGNDNGPLVAIVSDTSIKYIIWSNSDDSVDVGFFTLDSAGGFDGDTALKDAHITGSVYDDNTTIGTWVKSPEGGDFSGTRSTQVSQYAGFYSGTYTGDSTGTWRLTVLESGYLYGFNGNFVMEGGINDSGIFIAYDSTEKFGMNGTIAGSSISGKWTDADDGHDGTFTSASSSSKSASETGGCFIKSIY